MKKEWLKRYADLILQVGINIKAGEGLILQTTTEALDLARLVAKGAYAMGAKDVTLILIDDELERIRYEHGSDDVFSTYPDYKAEYLINLYDDAYSHAFLLSTDPNLLKGIDPKKIALSQKTVSSVARDTGLMRYRMTGKARWTIAAMPGQAWAKLVFPGLSPEAAVSRLGEAIAKAVRIDRDDPVAAWEAHLARLATLRSKLTELEFDRLHYKAPGTDLTVGLAEGHIWIGGAKDSQNKIPFVANMPTEEVFTTPDCRRIDGTLKSTMPLSVNGNLVEDFSFTFRHGDVVDFSAAKGEAILNDLLRQDKGAKSLGEVALVPDNSPISNANILFYNTLFDENASCHFALGQSYGYAIKDGDKLSDTELLERGANNSIIHTDFMVGGPDLQITGITKDGQSCRVFVDGNFAEELLSS